MTKVEWLRIGTHGVSGRSGSRCHGSRVDHHLALGRPVHLDRLPRVDAGFNANWRWRWPALGGHSWDH